MSNEETQVNLEVQKMMQEIIRDFSLPHLDPTKEFTVQMYHAELTRQGITLSSRSAMMQLENMKERGILTRRRVNVSGKSAMAYTKVKKDGD